MYFWFGINSLTMREAYFQYTLSFDVFRMMINNRFAYI